VNREPLLSASARVLKCRREGNAWLTTGGDPRAVVLQLATLGLSLAVYWPFVRREDRRLAGEEDRIGGGALPPVPPKP